MATNYKVLGQSCPSTTTSTVLYTVPAGTQTVVSTITVCDVGDAGGLFAFSIAVGGAADTPSQYLYGSPTNGIGMDPGDTFVATVGLTLGAGDVVRVRSSVANEMTFQMFGSEIS